MGSRVAGTAFGERAFRQPAIPIHEEFCPRLVRHLFQVLCPEPVCVEYPVVQAGVNFRNSWHDLSGLCVTLGAKAPHCLRGFGSANLVHTMPRSARVTSTSGSERLGGVPVNGFWERIERIRAQSA
jgi:hypothetical protein